MNNKQHDISTMSVITISRQYGSGGGEIAARLAQKLGWQLIDHEIVAQVAHELGITPEEAEARDEHVEGFVARVLSTMQLAAPAALVPAAIPSVSPALQEQAYREALRHVVETAANTGHTVIVGRAGQVLLAQRRDVLHVRIVAPPKQRITYVVRREGLDEASAQLRVQLKDHDRTRYLQMQHHRNVEDPLLYDLVINTGMLDLDSAVDLICLALERKAQRLAIPTGELGPAAGLARYPGQPSDLRPPDSLIEGEPSS